MRTQIFLAISLAATFTGCANGPETVTMEKKGKVTVIHHKRHTTDGTVDKIEAIGANGSYSQAEVKVYSVGRMIDQNGNVQEAHNVYRVVQSPRPNLALPKHVSSGPKTVYTPPNYVPPPNDQRLKDALDDVNKAKQKFEAATQARIQEDNNLRGQLQDQVDENQRLRDQLNAGMNTPKHQPSATTDAEKAAQSAINSIQ